MIALLHMTVIISCLVLWVLHGMKSNNSGVVSPRLSLNTAVPWYTKWHQWRFKNKTTKMQAFTQQLGSPNERKIPWYYYWYDRLRQGRKIILLYSTWFDQQEWGGLAGHELYRRIERCDKATNCLLTYDKSWLKEASGVVFHGRDVEEHRNSYYSARHLREVKRGLPSTQKWIFLSHENPRKDINIYKPYDGVFNWTATFSRKSNVFIPYQRYAIRVKPQKITRNYAREKTGLVAWGVSNCRSKLRLDYARHLQRYVNVTVYGNCNCFFLKRRSCKHFDADCNKELSKYKFYLAFENDFCHDYVTEKYWERIQQDVVPGVMGSNYDGLAIPGSYIDVNDFESIQELAEYLLYLDKNDDAYNKYFAYKTKYKDGNADFYCLICEKLNSKWANEHSEMKLSEEFNYEKNCGINRRKAEKFKRQIENAMNDRSNSLSLYKNIKC